jgi:hypothetical protein
VTAKRRTGRTKAPRPAPPSCYRCGKRIRWADEDRGTGRRIPLDVGTVETGTRYALVEAGRATVAVLIPHDGRRGHADHRDSCRNPPITDDELPRTRRDVDG